MVNYKNTVCVLVDNGSIRAEAILHTRKIGRMLENKIHIPVVPASIAHSDKIPTEMTEGIPVPLLKPLLHYLGETQRTHQVIVIPLILITGGAIFKKAEKTLKDVAALHPLTAYFMADGIISHADHTEISVAAILSQAIKDVISKNPITSPRIILVDHGSPHLIAAEQRNQIAQQIQNNLEEQMIEVIPASMERRNGSDYDFNEPLLQTAITQAYRKGSRNIVLARLFLHPGKHSGPDGDIDQICYQAQCILPELRFYNANRYLPPIGIINLLSQRVNNIVAYTS